ncbi:MAG: esterase [Gammaproteobacteria bacterium RIFCSPHIGHO2_12_FULL_43_28]|nr:MAG: esterase [Gammaproteobacteria bacterium RIFCSPHIGHO2_12_FULL_43_28]
MKIWKTKIDIELVTERAKNSMSEFLGIEFIEVSDNYLSARMSVDHRTKQPLGIMHGGASCVLAETIGSTAAQYCVDFATEYCVGLDINTNHIRAARSGFVIGKASPYHLGQSTQVWHIEITDEENRLVSVNRLTMAVLKRKQV